MRAIILAAGEGVRLRPHTLDRPKCLVELRGRALLRWQLSVLEDNSITDITIVTGYRADQVEALGYETLNNPDYATTNMVTTLMCAVDHFDGNDDLLVLYGDIVYEPSVLQALCANKHSLSTTIDRQWKRLWTLRSDDPLNDAETLKVAANGNIIELGKKTTSYADIQGQYMGLIKVQADFAPKLVEIYESLSPDESYDGKDLRNIYTTSFLQKIIDLGFPLNAAFVDGGWLEVDTADDLELYNNMSKEKLDEICRL